MKITEIHNATLLVEGNDDQHIIPNELIF